MTPRVSVVSGWILVEVPPGATSLVITPAVALLLIEGLLRAVRDVLIPTGASG